MTALAQPELHEALTLPSTLATVEAIEAKTEEFAKQAGFDEDTVSQIAMISREAAANAVLHGNRKDPNKHVRANFSVTSDNLSISVADEGSGFDPSAVPDPLSPEGLLKPSGRGIFLMRAIMDEVHFRELSPGTEITLVKHRN
ncbi:MAG TPA: ATP-binding protein [Acidobacteriaceae bacterium]|nr:ATP-binding protein [Acidobacteriaceae bacterium]